MTRDELAKLVLADKDAAGLLPEVEKLVKASDATLEASSVLDGVVTICLKYDGAFHPDESYSVNGVIYTLMGVYLVLKLFINFKDTLVFPEVHKYKSDYVFEDATLKSIRLGAIGYLPCINLDLQSPTKEEVDVPTINISGMAFASYGVDEFKAWDEKYQDVTIEIGGTAMSREYRRKLKEFSPKTLLDLVARG